MPKDKNYVVGTFSDDGQLVAIIEMVYGQPQDAVREVIYHQCVNKVERVSYDLAEVYGL